MLASTVFALTGLVSLSRAGYVLQDDYSPDKFFSMFDFFTAQDPTHGYVQYVSQSSAQSAGLINTNNNAIYMGVDSTNVASSAGRQSVRITSKKSYNHGLIILDLAHMPGGICGTWPAFWTVGPGWPNAGEIDIIEGVNSQLSNSMALHTGAGCSISNNGLFTGQIGTPNCNVAAAGQATNAGCSIVTSNHGTYGAGFNAQQGGVYATEWTSDGISIWSFARGAIPSDISSGNPDPSGWGMATAHFSGGCEIDNFFRDQQIVFDTTFCGDWAGNVWSSDPVCSSKAPTCQAYVQNNPSAFKDAYWSVNSLKVYSSDGSVSVQSAPGSRPSSAVAGSVPVVMSTSTSAYGGGPFPTPAAASTAWTRGGGRFTRSVAAVNNAAVVPETDAPAATPSSSLVADAEKVIDPTVAAASEPTPTPVPAADSSTPAETTDDVPPQAAAVNPDGSVVEVPAETAIVTATSWDMATVTSTLTLQSTTANPDPASAPSPSPVGGGGGGNIKYTTVSALEYDDFPKAKDKRSPEADTALELGLGERGKEDTLEEERERLGNDSGGAGTGDWDWDFESERKVGRAVPPPLNGHRHLSRHQHGYRKSGFRRS